MSNKAEEWLIRGSDLLRPLLMGHGFTYRTLNKGNSSGGQFAAGEFRRGTRRLEFHFRYSLGLVSYHLDSRSMLHQEYMCSVLGRPNASHYPGFSNDPMDAFRDLRLDMEAYCSDFLEGADDQLLRRIEDAHARPCYKIGLPD